MVYVFYYFNFFASSTLGSHHAIILSFRR